MSVLLFHEMNHFVTNFNIYYIICLRYWRFHFRFCDEMDGFTLLIPIHPSFSFLHHCCNNKLLAYSPARINFIAHAKDNQHLIQWCQFFLTRLVLISLECDKLILQCFTTEYWICVKLKLWDVAHIFVEVFGSRICIAVGFEVTGNWFSLRCLSLIKIHYPPFLS
jgi:hypothetical protein